MVSTFITKIPIVTVHVLHGEPWPVIDSMSWTVDMRAPPAHVCGLGSYPDKLQQRVWNHKRYTTHPGLQDMRTKERQCLNHSSHFSGVVGVNSGT